VFAALWALGALVAFLVTLPAVHPGEDFDGLNNLWQIPFALPWFLLPYAAVTNNHVVDAWIDFAMGLLNAGLLYWFLRRRVKAAG